MAPPQLQAGSSHVDDAISRRHDTSSQRRYGWIEAHPGASAREIYQFGGQLMDEYGLSGLPLVRYPRR